MIEALLQRAASQARWRRTAAWGLAVVSSAAAAWRIGDRIGVTPIATSLVVAMITAAFAVRIFRRRPIGTFTLVEHLNRSVPALEESAALLTRDPTGLSALERLQRARTIAAWQATASRPMLALPSAGTALLVAGAALVLGLLIPAIPRGGVTTFRLAGEPPRSPVALRIERTELGWVPPAYTGLPPRTAAALEATIEVGSMVSWRVAASGASAVRVVSAAGDTLVARRIDKGEWGATETIAKGQVWHIEANGSEGGVVRGEEHLLRVLADREPVVAVLAPEGRIELEWREPHVVVVRAVARDDYGLTRIRLAATVAKGRGEGVKFKENWLPVDVESRVGARELVASRMVHLDSLGVEPGDELFLAFEATDNRSPGPQSARSETIFLSLLDTLDASTAALSGLAIRVEPAYFRSQRQIILDTEALLRDVREGRVKDGGFARALEIGMDQHLLRLRYGGMVGDESNEEVGPDQDISGRHEHDMAENATLLSPTVKALLKSALAAMWDAERELRTGHPKPALPAEYRALASLEEVRRAERSYVKRIGFEPKPVDVGRTRLTKKADRMAPLTRQDSSVASENEPLLRDALVALDSPTSSRAKGSFEAAARRLAERALDSEPARHLETLRALRRLIDGPCDDCPEVARRGLLAALPPAPRPVRPLRSAGGALSTTAP